MSPWWLPFAVASKSHFLTGRTALTLTLSLSGEGTSPNHCACFCRRSSVAQLTRRPNPSVRHLTREPVVFIRMQSGLGLSNLWKREVVVTDQGLEWEALEHRQRVKHSLPYEAIDRVSVVAGRARVDCTVVLRSGDVFPLRDLDAMQIERALPFIRRRVESAHPRLPRAA